MCFFVSLAFLLKKKPLCVVEKSLCTSGILNITCALVFFINYTSVCVRVSTVVELWGRGSVHVWNWTLSTFCLL